jgi:addiction module RelB/DinJ family antitoxin
MSKYSVINLKTDPSLKEQAAKTADKLGVSVSAVLNNELRRFVAEQSVSFELPEVPNEETAELFGSTAAEIQAGDYFSFDDNQQALEFLRNETK